MVSQCLQISYLSLAYRSTFTPPLIPYSPPQPHPSQFITCFFRTPCNPDLMFIQRNPGGRVSFHPVEGFFSSEKDALAHLLGMNSSPSFPRIRFLKYFKKKKCSARASSTVLGSHQVFQLEWCRPYQSHDYFTRKGILFILQFTTNKV